MSSSSAEAVVTLKDPKAGKFGHHIGKNRKVARVWIHFAPLALGYYDPKLQSSFYEKGEEGEERKYGTMHQKSMGSKQYAEGDVNGEAKKGEKGDNEKDKQGDSSSDDDGKDESTQSVSYGTWAENLKKKAGEDSDLLEVEEAGEDSQ
nr:hypothetical protein Iba_chr01aCG19170 [Ipomoea batatas]